MNLTPHCKITKVEGLGTAFVIPLLRICQVNWASSLNTMFYFGLFCLFKCKASCAGLDRYGLERLMCLNAWPTHKYTTKRCFLFGVGVASLKEVHPCGPGLQDLHPSAWMSVFSCLPSEQNVELSAPSMLCLPGRCMLPPG